MQKLSARDAKYSFGRFIDTARAEPVTLEKHGRAVVVVMAVEEYERLKSIESEQHVKAARSVDKNGWDGMAGQALKDLAKEARATRRRGEGEGLPQDKIAFYDALAESETAVELIGNIP